MIFEKVLVRKHFNKEEHTIIKHGLIRYLKESASLHRLILIKKEMKY